MIRSPRSLLPAMALGLSLFAVYLRTLAPGLTWLHFGQDGGDLISAAATGGIPHPTGYPLYLLLARLFQLLPVGSLAYRTNLMSAVFTLLAALLIYEIVACHLVELGRGWSTVAGLAAGAAFGLAPLVWSQAVITEVYALQAFLTAWVLYLYSCPADPAKRKARDRWRGLALGLAVANHLTSLLLVPAALLLGSVARVREESSARSRLVFDLPALGRQLLWLALGLTLYLILPWRASGHPPIAWGNPDSLSRLAWVISGEYYRGLLLPVQASHAWEQLRPILALSAMQLGLFLLAIGLVGLALFERPSRLLFLTGWMALTSLAFVFFYRPADAEVYLLPLVICLSIWLGVGTGRLSHWLAQWSPAAGWAAAGLVLGIVLLRPLSYFSVMDASRDRAAEDFGRQVLSAAPQNALLFASGDQALFTLWYFHFALGQRPDVSVLATELLPYDWYQETLRSADPSLSLPPGPLLFPETIIRANPGRPVCQVRYTDQAEIECTPPLEERQ